MHILIVKHGALGDVVRTSYFAKPLKDKLGSGLRLSWITSPDAVPLLRFNPAVDDLWTDFREAKPFTFDHVYSLDDETTALRGVSGLSVRKITGACLDPKGCPTYTADSAGWFDMGLLSRFGKARADELKKANRRGHAEIFADLFGVERAHPAFFGDSRLEEWARQWIGDHRPVIGVNAFAGGRWPSKELPDAEFRLLIKAILDGKSAFGPAARVVLFGAGPDRSRNEAIVADVAHPDLRSANSDESVLRLAALIKALDYMITSDSLAMHLAISQAVPTLAFFAPTSADEIDDFGLVVKLASTAPDYCSYARDADNQSITADRMLEMIVRHAPIADREPALRPVSSRHKASARSE